MKMNLLLIMITEILNVYIVRTYVHILLNVIEVIIVPILHNIEHALN